MIQRITIEASQLQQASRPPTLTLSREQSHYLSRVLRLGVGAQFIAQDGQGHQWLSKLTDTPGLAQILSAISTASPTAPLRLVAGLPKGNSFDQVVRQACELGVSHIQPVISDRTLLKPSPQRLERWRRIAQEASEQSERVTVAEILEPLSFKDCLSRSDWKGFHYLCGERSQSSHLLAKLQQDLRTYRQSAGNSGQLPAVTVAVGPEGGWAADEITVAISYGYEVVTLGSAILRTTTASITALSLVTAARELLI